MLNIYIGKENLPADNDIIYDPDNAILTVDICGTAFQRKVIETIEQGQYHNTEKFVDRFGGQLYYTSMSTGSKTLLVVDALPDRIIDCTECGRNAVALFSLLDRGNIYFDHMNAGMPYVRDIPVICNGKYWSSISALNRLLR